MMHVKEVLISQILGPKIECMEEKYRLLDETNWPRLLWISAPLSTYLTVKRCWKTQVCASTQ